MIKHHPKFELLKSFVDGDLPASLSAGIAIHADMCKQCQKQIAQLTEQVLSLPLILKRSFLIDSLLMNNKILMT